MVNVPKQDKTKNIKTFDLEEQFYVSIVPKVKTIKLSGIKKGSQSSGTIVIVK